MADEKERKTLEQRHQMSDLERLRHSCAHVLATAVLKIWPDAQLAGGPPVESGFYYDIDLDHSITPDDFEKIEAEILKKWSFPAMRQWRWRRVVGWEVSLSVTR